jgi:hypothetical protein
MSRQWYYVTVSSTASHALLRVTEIINIDYDITECISHIKTALNKAEFPYF